MYCTVDIEIVMHYITESISTFKMLVRAFCNAQGENNSRLLNGEHKGVMDLE